jgi:prepilin-type processing-associated H-X9-DG protein/prepilin-type N-terminal cleavage/methylation domain-containing protein
MHQQQVFDLILGPPTPPTPGQSGASSQFARRTIRGGLPMCPGVNRGFTLVELLVVIAVIIALIALLLPALRRARDAAQSVQCLSNLRQSHMALSVYAAHNQGWIPAGGQVQHSSGLANYSWLTFLSPEYTSAHVNGGNYVKDLRTAACPLSDLLRRSQTSTWNLYQRIYGINKDDDQMHIQDVYQFNRPTSGVRVWWHPANTSSNRYFVFLNLYTPPDPTKTRVGACELRGGRSSPLLLADSIDALPYQSNYLGPVPSFDLDHADPGNANNNQLHARHNDRLNAVFFDGHAESVHRNQLFELGIRDYFFGISPMRLYKWDPGNPPTITITPPL